MPRFVKCNRAGHMGGDLIFEMIGDDGMSYQFQTSLDAFKGLFSMGWQAAKALPPAPAQGETDRLDAQMSFALLDAEPGLLLTSGALTLSIPLGEPGMVALEGSFADYRRTMNGPRH